MSIETKYYCKDCGKELSENERPCSKCGSSARNIELKLNDYFPAGSAELNSVKTRVQNFEQNGNFTDDTLMITKKEFETFMVKRDKDVNKKFLVGLIVGLVVGIAGIIVTIIVRFY